MVKLSHRQKEVLRALGRCADGCGGPQQVARLLGLKSRSSPAQVLARLARRGWVERVPGQRLRPYVLTDRARSVLGAP